MKLSSYLALTGAGLCGAAASILLKKASSLAPPVFVPRVLLIGFAAVAVYGLGFILYGLSLRTLNLTTAYVSMIAIAVLTLFVYTAWHGEPIRTKEIIGAVAVLTGVLLINWKSFSP